jgi:hypothetical protein
MVQATMYGRYHLTNPSSFYIANNAWELAPTSGTGSPDSSLPTDASGNTLRFVPEYEILQLPGSSQPEFTAIEPLDPLSQGDRIQTLAAFMTADCDYQDYGRLTAYVTPTSSATVGPAVVNSKIQSNTTVSTYVTLLGRAGSTVSLGTTLMIPINESLLYVRPLYVSSSQNPYPQLTRYIVVYGNQVSMESTLGSALADVFGAATSGIGGGSGAIPASVRGLLASAQSYYNKGLAALKNEDLATYYDDMQMVGKLLAEAESELKKTQKAASPTTDAPAAAVTGGTNTSPSAGTNSSGSTGTGATTTTTTVTATGPTGTA